MPCKVDDDDVSFFITAELLVIARKYNTTKSVQRTLKRFIMDVIRCEVWIDK